MTLIIILFFWAVTSTISVVIHICSKENEIRSPKGYLDLLLLTFLPYVLYCKYFYKKGLK
jgi:hypothetical protein